MKKLIIRVINSNLLIRKLCFSLKPKIFLLISFFHLLVALLKGKNFFGFIVCIIFSYFFIFYNKKHVKKKYSPIHYTLT